MSVSVHPVAAYRVHFYGRSASAGTDDIDKKAEIFLISTESQQDCPLVGKLAFYSPDVAATKQDGVGQDGCPQAHLDINEIGAVLDLLRHEKPLSLMWDSQRQLVWLATGPEHVGEIEYDIN